jgi:hypothetical protein
LKYSLSLTPPITRKEFFIIVVIKLLATTCLKIYG